jgi:hypothetical protein
MKLPNQMSRAELQKRADKLRDQDTTLNREAIALGRGHWRYTDIEVAAKTGDPLSMQELEVRDELFAVLCELGRIKDGYRKASPSKVAA